MSSEDPDKGEGIQVKDKRKFSADGTPREGVIDEGHADEPDATLNQAPSAPLPPADFSMFILSLSQSALLHLGVGDHPEGGRDTASRPEAGHHRQLGGRVHRDGGAAAAPCRPHRHPGVHGAASSRHGAG